MKFAHGAPHCFLSYQQYEIISNRWTLCSSRKMNLSTALCPRWWTPARGPLFWRWAVKGNRTLSLYARKSKVTLTCSPIRALIYPPLVMIQLHFLFRLPLSVFITKALRAPRVMRHWNFLQGNFLRTEWYEIGIVCLLNGLPWYLGLFLLAILE